MCHFKILWYLVCVQRVGQDWCWLLAETWAGTGAAPTLLSRYPQILACRIFVYSFLWVVNTYLCCIFGFACVWFGFGQEYLFCRWKLNDLLFQRLTDHSNSTPQSSTYSWSRELESEINFTCWISQDFTQVKITIDCKNMTIGRLMMTMYANFCMCSCLVSCLTIINKII